MTSRTKVGWDRAWVTASNPDASLISVGSLNAGGNDILLEEVTLVHEGLSPA